MNYQKKLDQYQQKDSQKIWQIKYVFLMAQKQFSLGMSQNYFVFIPAKKYIKHFSSTTWIVWWRYNVVSEESIENITKSDMNFAPTFVGYHLLLDITFNGRYLIKNNISIRKKEINLYFSYMPNSMIKKFQQIFYIEWLLISICKAN